MPRFDVDAQRVLICLFALAILMGEAISASLGGHTLPDALTYVLGGLAAGPVVDGIVGNAKSRYRDLSEEDRRQSSSDRRRDREDHQK